MMLKLTSEEVAFINHLIRYIGRQVEEMAVEELQVEEKAPGDFVTKVDREINTALLESMHQRFPNDGFISEESPPDEGMEKYERIWLVDPLDGTDNFLKRDGQYAVMIGLLVDRLPIFGWIYAPTRDKLYFGGKGYGVYCKEGDAQPQPMIPVSESELIARLRVIMGDMTLFGKK